jgi:hypothetical protein
MLLKMLIGSTIIGLAKLTRLMELAKESKSYIKSRINPSVFFTFTDKKAAQSLGTIKLGNIANPVPQHLVAMLFMKGIKSMHAANNNSAIKGRFTQREEKKVVQDDLNIINR